MGMAKFKHISGGRVNGRGQNLVKSQGQILASRLKTGGSKSLTPVAGGSMESMQPTSPCFGTGTN